MRRRGHRIDLHPVAARAGRHFFAQQVPRRVRRDRALPRVQPRSERRDRFGTPTRWGQAVRRFGAATSLVCAFATLLCAQGAIAEVEVSLPQQGSYHVGTMMPVSLKLGSAPQRDDELTIVADVAIPTRVLLHGRSEATVPLLVLLSNFQKLRVIDASGRE